MDILSYLPLVYQKFIVFILVLTRISALFSSFILFRQDLVSPRIVIALSVILSLYVIPFNNIQVQYDIFSIGMLMQVLLQSLLGFIAGLTLNIVFEVVSAFGQLLSTQIGFGIASLFDPKLGNITTLTHFYAFSILIIFLLSNGHLYMIKMILDSFTIIPVGHTFMPTKMINELLRYSGVIFSGSITLSISIMMAILISNLALALLSKFSPQFNLFSVGINMTIIVGLFYVYITFNLFVEKGGILLESGLGFFKHLLMKSG